MTAPQQWLLGHLLLLFEEQYGHPFTATDEDLMRLEPDEWRIETDRDPLWCETRIRAVPFSGGGHVGADGAESGLQLDDPGQGGADVGP